MAMAMTTLVETTFSMLVLPLRPLRRHQSQKENSFQLQAGAKFRTASTSADLHLASWHLDGAQSPLLKRLFRAPVLVAVPCLLLRYHKPRRADKSMATAHVPAHRSRSQKQHCANRKNVPLHRRALERSTHEMSAGTAASLTRHKMFQTLWMPKTRRVSPPKPLRQIKGMA